MSEIRTRFAPSPTGHLHIGGARTALYNWLLARGSGGTFVLRIEDTDRERSTEESIRGILDGMKWLGLDWDEGPFFQSRRGDLYAECRDQLLAEGKAYRCYCTPEQLERQRELALAEGGKVGYPGTCRNAPERPGEPHAIRFRTPDEGQIVIEDRVKGAVRFDASEIDDFIIFRSDGSPTYNFVVVADDADMRISEVIRGDDHLNNTPKQLLLYRALGFPVPRFAHLPLILGEDRSRLSKRHGATSVLTYRDQGYLPEAVVNFLARLGWSHGDEEFFTADQLVAAFSIEKVGKAGGVFNPEKLDWLNGQHMRRADPAHLAALLQPFLLARGFKAEQGEWLRQYVIAYRERTETLQQMADAAPYLFADQVEIQEKAAAKFLKLQIRGPLLDLADAIEALEDFSEQGIEKAVEGVIERHGIKLGKLAQPVRVAVTGGTASPGLYQTLWLIGKKRCADRLRRAASAIAQG